VVEVEMELKLEEEPEEWFYSLEDLSLQGLMLWLLEMEEVVLMEEIALSMV
tara:strand:- start:469 stop:621 length:153 start_codon:yes stop_codon:yes gene_type:complete